MNYPAVFKLTEGGQYVVTFRDIPEAITQGDTEAEALDMAADALLTAMDFYFEDRRPVPPPSAPVEASAQCVRQGVAAQRDAGREGPAG
jgi:antitoxin HicB